MSGMGTPSFQRVARHQHSDWASSAESEIRSPGPGRCIIGASARKWPATRSAMAMGPSATP